MKRSIKYFAFIKDLRKKAYQFANALICPIGVVDRHTFKHLEDYYDGLPCKYRKAWDAIVQRVEDEYHKTNEMGYSAAMMDRAMMHY